MSFDIHVTNLAGDELARFEEFDQTEVIIPLCDSRTAKTLVSLYDPTLLKHGMSLVHPLNRMLKIWYNKHLVFWGRMLKPIWDTNALTVEINCIDASIMYKHRYHHYGNAAVNYGYFCDGTGMRVLAESAEPSQTQIARGIPRVGMYWGHDLTTHTPHVKPAAATLEPVAGEGWFRKVARGDNVWQTMTDFSQLEIPALEDSMSHIIVPAAFGPDFELEPVDAQHLPVGGVWSPGYHAQLNTYDRQGTDKSGTVIFHNGFGRNNTDQLVYEPDGDLVENYAAIVYPGGPRGSSDNTRVGLAHDEASWLEYGIHGYWQTAQTGDPLDLLKAAAKTHVKYYAQPLDTFTITPTREFRTAGNVGAIDRLGDQQPYKYIDDFIVGDVVSAAVKKGALQKELPGRITKVTLTQVDSDRNVDVTLDVVPEVGATSLDGGPEAP